MGSGADAREHQSPSNGLGDALRLLLEPLGPCLVRIGNGRVDRAGGDLLGRHRGDLAGNQVGDKFAHADLAKSIYEIL